MVPSNFFDKKYNNPLTKENVHIWSAKLEASTEELNYFNSFLSPDEHERALSFVYIQDRQKFIIARGILRHLLAKYICKSAQNIEVLYGMWGKPCVADNYNLKFNMSHSKEYALFAFSCSYELGIDLEYIDDKVNVHEIALNILNDDELAYFKTLNSQDKIVFFYKLWACKEAYLKSLGKGWLKEQQQIPSMLFSICKSPHTQPFSNKTYPYYFKCISGYASAIFIDGPPLMHIYYNWKNKLVT